VCLTIAPAFIAAGLYLTLSRTVITSGPEKSHIKPHSYSRIFIPCDVISLLLQAAGGGITSATSNANRSPDVGDHIMVTGLAFQVLTLAVFICLCIDFTIRTLRRTRDMGNAALDPSHATLRASTVFRSFVAALAFATLCIFIRSVYRVAELSEGWQGALIKNQYTFIGLEGPLVLVAVLALHSIPVSVSEKSILESRRRGRMAQKGANSGEEQVEERFTRKEVRQGKNLGVAFPKHNSIFRSIWWR